MSSDDAFDSMFEPDGSPGPIKQASDRAEIESLRKRVAELESLVDQAMWSLSEGDRILLQASANIQEHVAHGNELQARAERLQAALEEARDAITNIGEELARIASASFDYFEESNQEKESEWFGAIGNTANFARTLYESPALKAITAALAGDTAKPEANP